MEKTTKVIVLTLMDSGNDEYERNTFDNEADLITALQAECAEQIGGDFNHVYDQDKLIELLKKFECYDEVCYSEMTAETHIYECDNCGHIAAEDDTIEVADMSIRLSPGGVYTDRQCACCGALAYPQSYEKAMVSLGLTEDPTEKRAELVRQLSEAAISDFWEEADALDPEEASRIRELLADAESMLRNYV